MFNYCPVLCEVSPWGSGEVSWSSGPRCEHSDPDLHWPETETTNSDTHGFVFSEQTIRAVISEGEYWTAVCWLQVKVNRLELLAAALRLWVYKSLTLWYHNLLGCVQREKVYGSDDKNTLYSHKYNNKSCVLTPSPSSTTGTGVDLRLETTSLSPLLLALTRYWSERTGQGWFIFNSNFSWSTVTNLNRLYEYVFC